MPEPYTVPEETLPETSKSNIPENIGENMPKTSEPSTKHLKAYNRKTKEELDLTKLFDQHGDPFDIARHVCSEKDGKLLILITKNGYCMVSPRASKKEHVDKVANKLARLDKQQVDNIKQAEVVAGEKVQQVKLKTFKEKSTKLTAKLMINGFLTGGQILCGKKFKEAHDSELDELYDSAEEWLSFHEDFRASPGMSLAGAMLLFAGARSNKIEPDSIVGRLLPWNKKKKEQSTPGEEKNEAAS
jgi:hypothetical protein